MLWLPSQKEITDLQVPQEILEHLTWNITVVLKLTDLACNCFQTTLFYSTHKKQITLILGRTKVFLLKIAGVLKIIPFALRQRINSS
jgi:hypothetical protein